jgi:hypothetical protein
MAQLGALSRHVCLKIPRQTLYGTQIVPQKTCVTRAVIWRISGGSRPLRDSKSKRGFLCLLRVSRQIITPVVMIPLVWQRAT